MERVRAIGSPPLACRSSFSILDASACGFATGTNHPSDREKRQFSSLNALRHLRQRNVHGRPGTTIQRYIPNVTDNADNLPDRIFLVLRTQRPAHEKAI